jgi:hypothetical protein
MPIFTITDPETGATLKVRGDQPPTDDEITELFNVQRSQGNQNRLAAAGRVAPLQKPPSPTTFEGTQSLPSKVAEAAVRNAPVPSVDEAVNMIPAASGAVGSAIGGAGGTVLGMGVGGVPGAIGGGAAGTAGGEALRQLIQRARGQAAPATPEAAAQDIGVAGLIGGASEALPLAGGAMSRGMYGRALKGADEAIMEANPGIIQRGIDEGLTVTRGGTRRAAQIGSDLAARAKAPVSNFLGKAGKAALASSGEEASTLAQAMRGARGSRVPTSDFGRVLSAFGLPGGGAGMGTAIGSALGAGPLGALVGGGIGLGAKVAGNPAVQSGAAIALDRMLPGLAPTARLALLKLLQSTDEASTPQP